MFIQTPISRHGLKEITPSRVTDYTTAVNRNLRAYGHLTTDILLLLTSTLTILICILCMLLYASARFACARTGFGRLYYRACLILVYFVVAL